MKETVDLEGLSTKIYGKYLKFLQQKVHEVFDSPNAPPADRKVHGVVDSKRKNELHDGFDTQDDTINFSEIPVENSNLQKAAGLV